MGGIRWSLFAAIMILLITVCKHNVHQKHFNLFILGLFLLISVIIVVFWLMGKGQGVNTTESMQEHEEMDSKVIE